MATEETPPQLEGRPGSEPDERGDELKALQTILAAVHPLGAEAQQRIIGAVSAFLGIDAPPKRAAVLPRAEAGSSSASYPPFSADTSMSPKEFLLHKQPRTDVERIACLAYYLTHYRDIPHFKTLDLSKLNTEAAQPKFSNAATSANNAVKRGYLVTSTKGHRQLSAGGELFVEALPDRDAAKQAMASMRPRKSRRPTRKTSTGGNT
jgi:hypothetical protein